MDLPKWRGALCYSVSFCTRSYHDFLLSAHQVPPALFTRDSTGSPASSSATNYDEQSRTMTMFDDTSDDIGHCEPLTPTFPYRQCYETGRPFLYSQQQVITVLADNIRTHRYQHHHFWAVDTMFSFVILKSQKKITVKSVCLLHTWSC